MKQTERTQRAAMLPVKDTDGPPHRLRDILRDDRGAATAEYAVATMAAVAFVGLLLVIMRSDEVRGMLTDLVRRALSVP